MFRDVNSFSWEGVHGRKDRETSVCELLRQSATARKHFQNGPRPAPRALNWGLPRPLLRTNKPADNRALRGNRGPERFVPGWVVGDVSSVAIQQTSKVRFCRTSHPNMLRRIPLSFVDDDLPLAIAPRATRLSVRQISRSGSCPETAALFNNNFTPLSS